MRHIILITGRRTLTGAVAIEEKIPTRGRLKTSKIKLAKYIAATKPQKRSGAF